MPSINHWDAFSNLPRKAPRTASRVPRAAQRYIGGRRNLTSREKLQAVGYQHNSDLRSDSPKTLDFTCAIAGIQAAFRKYPASQMAKLMRFFQGFLLNTAVA